MQVNKVLCNKRVQQTKDPFFFKYHLEARYILTCELAEWNLMIGGNLWLFMGSKSGSYQNTLKPVRLGCVETVGHGLAYSAADANYI